MWYIGQRVYDLSNEGAIGFITGGFGEPFATGEYPRMSVTDDRTPLLSVRYGDKTQRIVESDDVDNATPCVVDGYVHSPDGQTHTDQVHDDHCCGTMICSEQDYRFRVDGHCIGHDMGYTLADGPLVDPGPTDEEARMMTDDGRPTRYTRTMLSGCYYLNFTPDPGADEYCYTHKEIH